MPYTERSYHLVGLRLGLGLMLGLGFGLVSVVRSFRRPVVAMLIRDRGNTVGFALFLFCDLEISVLVLVAFVGILGRTNASQNVRTACKKCGYGKMMVTF